MACDNCNDRRLSKLVEDHPLGGPLYRPAGKGRLLCDVCYDDLISMYYDAAKDDIVKTAVKP